MYTILPCPTSPASRLIKVSRSCSNRKRIFGLLARIQRQPKPINEGKMIVVA